MKTLFVLLTLVGMITATSADGECSCKLASSCKEMFEQNPLFPSSVYKLLIDSQEVSVYCHKGDSNGCGNGGWTMVMKIDGTLPTFIYDSNLWRNQQSHNLAGGQTGFDGQETKLPTYWNTPFSKICLGMMVDQTIRFIVINKQASSLYSLIADGQYRATSLGRDTWKSLIGPEASLQLKYNREGFNTMGSNVELAKARIGIVANNENVCTSCDSRIGFGTGGHDESSSCGNDAPALWDPDNGEKHIKAMGYILVQ